MGHPWEALLIRMMRKYRRLYLSNSAGWRSISRPRWSLHGLLGGPQPLDLRERRTSDRASRALDEAKRLPISEPALTGFLGTNALEALGARRRADRCGEGGVMHSTRSTHRLKLSRAPL